MVYFTAFFIAIGLGVDVLSISFSIGLTNISRKKRIILAAIFALFHICMPLIGWFLGTQFLHQIADYDHWIALALLGGFGGKMIHESFQCCEDKDFSTFEFKPLKILTLSIATSIDALGIGIGFIALQLPLISSILIFGIVTMIMSLIGSSLGKQLGCYLSRRAELIGGLILIAIGINIVIEHTLFTL